MPDPFVRVDILYWLKMKNVQEGPTKVKGMFPVRDIFRDMQLIGHEIGIVRRELNYLIKRDLVISETLCSNVDECDLVKIALPGLLHLRLLKNVTYLAACAEDVSVPFPPSGFMLSPPLFPPPSGLEWSPPPPPELLPSRSNSA